MVKIGWGKNQNVGLVCKTCFTKNHFSLFHSQIRTLYQGVISETTFMLTANRRVR